MITTEAWVLYEGDNRTHQQPAELIKETITFPEIAEEEVLVEPVYGCWEANLTHALKRSPVDICRQRGDKKVVLGNSGVVRVLQPGSAVSTVREGDLCVFFPIGVWDDHGYPKLIHAYDAPGTMGLFAKRLKVHHQNVIPVPNDSNHSLHQWAAFSGRYITAWANWNVAYGCWRTQMEGISPESATVAGWGGGVSLAELTLAKYYGFQTLMIASTDQRLQLIESMGITGIDRREFAGLNYNDHKYHTDPQYRKVYQTEEKTFIDIIMGHTEGKGVDIFIDNIGTPVFRGTLRVLARQGVITTAGWKCGMEMSLLRAVECIKRHIHVFTHFARHSEGVEAVSYAEANGWIPPDNNRVYDWENIPQLAYDYEHNRLDSYFPLYAVNPE